MERHKSDAANGGKMADSDANEPADGFDELAESQDELIATARSESPRTREMVAEAQEHVHDIVAEVDAEGDKKAATSKSSPRSSMPAA